MMRPLIIPTRYKSFNYYSKASACHILLLFVVVLAIYSNSLNVPFQFDDESNISEAPFVKNFRNFINPSDVSEHRLYELFQSRPVGFLTLAVNYAWHGLEVTGYHIVNIIIHFLNSVLLYSLVLLCFKSSHADNSRLKPKSYAVALIAALLFVCHPVQTQAVTYIIQRFASLATLFYIAGLVFYILYRIKVNSGRRAALTAYLASIISVVLAMKTKEIAITLPLMIIFFEFLFFSGSVGSRIKALLPFLLTLIIIPYGRVVAAGGLEEATRMQSNIDRFDYLNTQFCVIVTYLRLLLLPINQNLDYDYHLQDSFLSIPVLVSFSLVLTLFSLGFYMLYKSITTNSFTLRLAAAGIFWFFITISVESSLIPITDVIFEHRLYLPAAGLFISVTALLLNLAEKQQKKARLIAFILITMTITAYATATYSRNIIWQNEITLWEDVVAKSPRKARGHIWLAKAYKKKGITNKAIEHLNIAISLADDLSEMAAYNLAAIYSAQGQTDKALNLYLKSLTIKPDFKEAHMSIGLLMNKTGRHEESIKHYLLALKLDPNYEEALYNLGITYLNIGRLAEAEKSWKKILEVNSSHSMALNSLGNLLAMNASFKNASIYYLRAIEANHGNPEALYNLANAYEAIGNIPGAIKYFKLFLNIAQGDFADLKPEVKRRLEHLKSEY